MDQVYTIFPQQLNAQTAILSILLFIFSVGLYHSLFVNLLKKYLQELFFATKHFESNINRSFLYLFMTSLPMIILTFISLFYNDSLVGLQASMTIDEFNILIVTGYICWIEESRHTPIRGMHLIRDVIFAILFISLFINSFYAGDMTIDQPISVVIVFILYYLVLSYFEGIEDFLMRILGLKESNNYNAKFLLTSKYTIPDFLEIKDIISEKQQLIEDQLSDYKQILINLQQNEQDQEILMNFAKLFLPIKKAYQIKQQIDNKQALKQIQTTWSQGSVHSSDSQQNDQEPIKNSPTYQSSDGLGFYLKHTYTDDFINQDQQKVQELNLYEKIMKYVYYPVYLASFAQGRLFYFAGYLGLGLLIGSMFGISNSIVYFSSSMNSLSIVSIITASLLTYPSAKYCIKISSNNDYDFTNIFLQCMILKLGISSLLFIVYDEFFNSKIYVDKGAFICLVVRIGLMGIYLIFMIINRFATRFNNFKYFIGFLLISWCGKVLSQNVYNNVG